MRAQTEKTTGGSGECIQGFGEVVESKKDEVCWRNARASGSPCAHNGKPS
jgi:hypothetical protein